MTHQEAIAKLRYQAGIRRGAKIEISHWDADELRNAIEIVLKRLDRLESLVEIVRAVEKVE